MVGVIIVSRKMGINPDNVATPIAASLGDLITLSLLAGIGSFVFQFRGICLLTCHPPGVSNWVWLLGQSE